jgi:leucyl/phenylalanyl-tRNA--protein transferase
MQVANDTGIRFPPADNALPDGLVAIGGALTSARLLAAYRAGIFPWSANPVTWWSPDPRAIIELNAFHVPRTLAKLARRKPFRVTRDWAFRAVMEGCAAPGPGRAETWITPEFLRAYMGLHEEGHAHSVECWSGDELAGGIYGVAVNGLFAGESMFHRAANASKLALLHLLEHLRNRGFTLFDIQMLTPATRQFGAIEISRPEYLNRLAAALDYQCEF